MFGVCWVKCHISQKQLYPCWFLTLGIEPRISNMLGIFPTIEPLITFFVVVILELYVGHACSLPLSYTSTVYVVYILFLLALMFKLSFSELERKGASCLPPHSYWSHRCPSTFKLWKAWASFPTASRQMLADMNNSWQRHCDCWIFYANMPAEQ